MKEILDFLAASPAFYVGTVDENNQPARASVQLRYGMGR